MHTRERNRRHAMAHAVAAIACVALPHAHLTDVHAHVGHVIARAERYLKLDASETDTRLVVSLMLGADEGARVLRDADLDRDGAVSPAESDAYLARWGEGLGTELPVTIDGEPIAVAWTEGWLDPIGRVRRAPLTIEMVAHLPTRSGEHTIAFDDRMVRRETFDRTDVAFRVHSPVELVGCGASTRDPRTCLVRDLVIVPGAPQPGSFAARFRYPAAESATDWLPVALVAGTAVVLALVATAALRKRRARGAR
jgi:hypothetical protein